MRNFASLQRTFGISAENARCDLALGKSGLLKTQDRARPQSAMLFDIERDQRDSEAPWSAEEPKSLSLAPAGTSQLNWSFASVSLRPLQVPKVQTKLTINKPGDEYEQEADRAAEQVMRPSPLSGRNCRKTRHKRQPSSRMCLWRHVQQMQRRRRARASATKVGSLDADRVGCRATDR